MLWKKADQIKELHYKRRFHMQPGWDKLNMNSRKTEKCTYMSNCYVSEYTGSEIQSPVDNDSGRTCGNK